MTYSTVTIATVDHDVLADTTEIDAHIATRLGAAADAWTAASVTNKPKLALAATRMFERIAWDGTATSTLSFPRSGLLYADGSAVSSSTIPDQVVEAVAELAAALALDPAMYERSEANAGGRVQSLSAGPTSVSFFRAAPGSSARLPVTVRDLVGLWFAGAASPATIAAYGTERPSAFNDGDSETEDADDPADRYDFSIP